MVIIISIEKERAYKTFFGDLQKSYVKQGEGNLKLLIGSNFQKATRLRDTMNQFGNSFFLLLTKTIYPLSKRCIEFSRRPAQVRTRCRGSHRLCPHTFSRSHSGEHHSSSGAFRRQAKSYPGVNRVQAEASYEQWP